MLALTTVGCRSTQGVSSTPQQAERHDYTVMTFTGTVDGMSVSGQVLMEPYVNDVRQGEGHRRDLKGHLLQTMTFKNGFEEGISPIFDTTGLLREIITYRKGFIMTREAINRYDKEGKKHGYWKTFFDDWSLHTECYYRHGLREGFYKEYDESGAGFGIRFEAFGGAA